MSRVFRRLSIYPCLMTLGLHLSATFSADAQVANCNRITEIFALPEWRALAIGPFEQLARSDIVVRTRAPARGLIEGFGVCMLWVTEYSQEPRIDFSYACRGPDATAGGSDHLVAAKTVATQWRGCFANWAERADSSSIAALTAAIVQFSKDNLRVSFTRDNIESQHEPVSLSLGMTVRN